MGGPVCSAIMTRSCGFFRVDLVTVYSSILAILNRYWSDQATAYTWAAANHLAIPPTYN